MTEQPTTAAGQELLDAHMSGQSLSEHDPEDDPCWLKSRILAIEAEARQQDGSGLRTAAEAMYQRIMRAHEDAIGAGDAHQWWHNLESEWRSLGAALDFAYGVLPPSAPPALDLPMLAEAIKSRILTAIDTYILDAEYARLQEGAE